VTDFQIPASADEATRALNEALAKAQGAFPAIPRSKTVSTKAYKYSYASLDQILGKCRKALAENGLSIVQLLESNGSGPQLRTELRHAGGAVVGSSYPFVAPDSPQALGSLLTYLRRYAITALLGIATEEDDDGQAAEGAKPKPKAETPPMIDEAQRGQIDVALKTLVDEAPQHEGQLSWPAQLRERFKVESKEDLTREQAGEVIEWLKFQLDQAGIPF